MFPPPSQALQLLSLDNPTDSILQPLARMARTGDLSGFFTAADNSSVEDRKAAFEVARLTEGVISDIWTLSYASHFIGTCLSQVSRLSYDLAYARGMARSPPVGLDSKACREHPVHFFPIAADWRESFDEWWDA